MRKFFKMKSKESTGICVYRFGDQGLEVFLVKPDNEINQNWEIPDGFLSEAIEKDFDFIRLDDVTNTKDETTSACAFEDESEVETFDLPLKRILGKTESPFQLRRKHKYISDNGCYFVIKEAIKKVFPEQVVLLKELQEVLRDRNMIRHI